MDMDLDMDMDMEDMERLLIDLKLFDSSHRGDLEGVLFALLEGLGEVRPGGGDLRNGRTNKLLPVKSNKKISDNRIASIEISPIFIFGNRH